MAMSTKTQFIGVIDDEPDTMSLFRDALSQIEGTTVFGFTESPLALEHFKLNQLKYCLILSDFRLAVMDGMELLKIVKAINPSVKTILLTGWNEKVYLRTLKDRILKKHKKLTHEALLINEVLDKLQSL